MRVVSEGLTSGTWRERVRWAVRLVTPWGLEWWLYWRRQAGERRRLQALHARRPPQPEGLVEESIRLLVARGLDEVQVREGSVPASALNLVSETLEGRLPSGRPLRALHIGNFVGVSLCYLSSVVTQRHPESLVVSIDPNVAHRGIDNPQSHVLALLDHHGLLDRNLIISGYTLERSEGAINTRQYERVRACENVLVQLSSLAPGGFDLVFIDGNHEAPYLLREIETIRRLLVENAIVVIDDIGDWPGVKEVFAASSEDSHFATLEATDRVGILQFV